MTYCQWWIEMREEGGKIQDRRQDRVEELALEIDTPRVVRVLEYLLVVWVSR